MSNDTVYSHDTVSADGAAPVGDGANSNPAQTADGTTSEPQADADEALMADAVRNLRSLILAGEHYRQTMAEAIGLGTTESQALSYLAVHGDSGQSDLARDLGLTSSAATALVDRLERQNVAERVRHPRDRRRSIIRVTERGATMVLESHRWLAAALTSTLEQVHCDDLAAVSRSLAVLAGDLYTRTSSSAANNGWKTHALPI